MAGETEVRRQGGAIILSGQTIGSLGIAMNQRGDYVCETKFTLACTAYDGFVTVVQP